MVRFARVLPIFPRQLQDRCASGAPGDDYAEGLQALRGPTALQARDDPADGLQHPPLVIADLLDIDPGPAIIETTPMSQLAGALFRGEYSQKYPVLAGE